MTKVINDLVGYDKLKIVQDNDYFNFSLESILLPRFCVLKPGNNKILDLCTGNGPIPIVLSTLTDSQIIGVEIQEEVYKLAVETVKINHLEDRIKLYNMDAKDIINIYPTDSFDLITCNPPYFRYDDNSNINDNKVKSIARHEITINLDNIALIARKLLKNNGSLCLVHRTDRLSEIICTLEKHNLEVKRLRLIYPKDGEESNLVLIDARKNGNTGLKVLSPLVCHNNDGSYTDEVLRMFER